jgi:predicted metalloprotease
MDWTPGGMSSDVEDRRGSSGGGFGGGGIGIVGFIFLVIISLITGRNYIGSYLAGGGHVATTNSRPAASSPAEDRSAQLVSYVLDDVQHEWETLLPEQANKSYRHAKLVLFRDYTRSGCGTAQSQTGPFYSELLG